MAVGDLSCPFYCNCGLLSMNETTHIQCTDTGISPDETSVCQRMGLVITFVMKKNSFSKRV